MDAIFIGYKKMLIIEAEILFNMALKYEQDNKNKLAHTMLLKAVTVEAAALEIK